MQNRNTVVAVCLTLLALMVGSNEALAATGDVTYPAATDLVSNVSAKFGEYFSAAIAFSMTAVAAFAAWRYMKKAGSKV